MRTILFILALSAIGCESVPNYVLTPPTAPSPSPSPTPPPTPPTNGPAELRLTVSVGPNSPIAGISAAFNALVTPTPTAPVSYAWNFGDGATRTVNTESTFYAYTRAGVFDPSVTVTDGAGRTVTGTQHVTVQNPPPPPEPTPTPTPTPTPPPALSVTISCTAGGHTPVPPTLTSCNVTAAYGSTTLPGSAVTGVDWDWADGSAIDHLAIPVGSHQYTAPGTFTIFATVTASTVDGPKTATTSLAVKVP